MPATIALSLRRCGATAFAAFLFGCASPRLEPHVRPRAEVRPPISQWEGLRDPKTGQIPSNVRVRELQAVSLLPKASKDSEFEWIELGPNDSGGRTRALAVDLDDPDSVLAAGVNGGVWKSEDRGASWRLTRAPTIGLGVTTLVQDPRPGHRHTWYCGTGESFATSQDAGFKIGSARKRHLPFVGWRR